MFDRNKSSSVALPQGFAFGTLKTTCVPLPLLFSIAAFFHYYANATQIYLGTTLNINLLLPSLLT